MIEPPKNPNYDYACINELHHRYPDIFGKNKSFKGRCACCNCGRQRNKRFQRIPLYSRKLKYESSTNYLVFTLYFFIF